MPSLSISLHIPARAGGRSTVEARRRWCACVLVYVLSKVIARELDDRPLEDLVRSAVYLHVGGFESRLRAPWPALWLSELHQFRNRWSIR